MVRPVRKRKPVNRYSPPPIPTPKRKRYTSRPPRKPSPLPPKRKISRPPRKPPKPKKIRFWHKIPKKTPYQKELEARAFGIDGIWRLIKSYIFWNSANRVCCGEFFPETPCSSPIPHKRLNDAVYTFEHQRWGRTCKGRFKEPRYSCAAHDFDFDFDLDFNIRCAIS